MVELTNNKTRWIPLMRRALQLAALGEVNASPNPLVGAIVLSAEGTLVGEGFHFMPGQPHAEINALDQAGNESKGGTLVVTLEPCCHYGRTPPCTEAIISAGISKVIVALKDPDPRVSGQGIVRLKEAGIEVELGVLEKEAAYQNRAFIFRITTGRPWGILKWAMSLDGRICLPNGASKWISSPKAREWVHCLRSKCDAIIVGGQTVRKDNPLLTSRGLCSPEPFRVVFSEKCEFSKKEIIWNTEVAKTFLAYGPSCKERAENLNFLIGPDLLPLPNSTPSSLLEALALKGCNKVLWECGPSLSSIAIQEGCVQELAVVIAPKLLGGLSANTPLSNFGLTSIDQALSIENIGLDSIDKDLLIRGSLDIQKSDFFS